MRAWLMRGLRYWRSLRERRALAQFVRQAWEDAGIPYHEAERLGQASLRELRQCGATTLTFFDGQDEK